jgi:hypothetical protein
LYSVSSDITNGFTIGSHNQRNVTQEIGRQIWRELILTVKSLQHLICSFVYFKESTTRMKRHPISGTRSTHGEHFISGEKCQ